MEINSIIFRKINHKQGIEWIRQLNNGVTLNLSKSEPAPNSNLAKEIVLMRSLTKPTNPISNIFPEEDFCIYVDFPFNQFVIIKEVIYDDVFKAINTDTKFTCTYLWLIQYYEFYSRYYFNIYNGTDNYISEAMNSSEFKAISKCNFEEKKIYCNKSMFL